MASTSAVRLWRACKEAGRSWPVLDDDEVIDFQIMEAVALKVNREDKKEAQKRKGEEFKHDEEGLEKLRQIAG